MGYRLTSISNLTVMVILFTFTLFHNILSTLLVTILSPRTTAHKMARLKVVRTVIIIFVLICGIAGYVAHTLLRRYTITTTPLTSLYTAEKNTATHLEKHGDGLLPPQNETHKEIQVGRAKDEMGRLIFGQDGLVRNWEDGQRGGKSYSKRSSRVRFNHPIYRLIDEGHAKWAKLLER